GPPAQRAGRAERHAEGLARRDDLDDIAVSAPDTVTAPVFARNPVLELLRARRRQVEEIAVLSEGRGPALQELLWHARRGWLQELRALAGLSVAKISHRTRDQLTDIAGTPHHQGVVARVAGAEYASLEDVLAVPGQRSEPAFFLALDQVQDPRNLGAILRSAE